MTDPDEDLEAVLDDLTTTLQDLRSELESTRRRPPRGPLGLPRPPTPRELLEFADEAAIPAIVAVLEANVRALTALQQAIRLFRREEQVRDGAATAREGTAAARERAAELGRTSLSRLDDALADLQSAIEGGEIPEDDPARDLLQEARDLQTEVEERLASGGSRDRGRRSDSEGYSVPVSDPADEATEGDEEGADRDDATTRNDSVAVDVDAELESIKREYGMDDEEKSGDDGDDDGGGR